MLMQLLEPLLKEQLLLSQIKLIYIFYYSVVILISVGMGTTLYYYKRNKVPGGFIALATYFIILREEFRDTLTIYYVNSEFAKNQESITNFVEYIEAGYIGGISNIQSLQTLPYQLFKGQDYKINLFFTLFMGCTFVVLFYLWSSSIVENSFPLKDENNASNNNAVSEDDANTSDTDEGDSLYYYENNPAYDSSGKRKLVRSKKKK